MHIKASVSSRGVAHTVAVQTGDTARNLAVPAKTERRAFTLLDPSGVLWRIARNLPRAWPEAYTR
jgi:hypothetical protein